MLLFFFPILCSFFKEGKNHADQTTENLKKKLVTLVNTNMVGQLIFILFHISKL